MPGSTLSATYVLNSHLFCTADKWDRREFSMTDVCNMRITHD